MVQRFSITLAQLSYFAVCAKTLNMTEASQELHIAQSAVSASISQLERALGAPLFVRQHSKGLALTPAGESLFRETREIFERINDAVELVQACQREVRGTVVISCFRTLAPFILPRLLQRVEQRHPDLQVDVIEGDHDKALAALRSGRAELSINYDLTSADGIDSEIVAMAKPHVIVSDRHPLAMQKSVALAQLANDSLVLLDLPDSRDYFLNLLRLVGNTPHVRYQSSNYETVRSMVAMGLGFSILNQRPEIGQTYSGERVSILEISDALPALHVTVSTLAGAKGTARAAAVAELVREIASEGHTSK